jgi:hypothetical protein
MADLEKSNGAFVVPVVDDMFEQVGICSCWQGLKEISRYYVTAIAS